MSSKRWAQHKCGSSDFVHFSFQASDGLQPSCDGVMASNLLAMASNLIGMEMKAFASESDFCRMTRGERLRPGQL